MTRLTVFFLIFGVIGWADFNRTSGLIDIPTAGILSDKGLRIGLDGSFAIDPDKSIDIFDENFHAAIGIGDHFEGYFDIYTIKNFTAAIGFCHRFYQQKNLALAWGIHTISYDLDVSEVGHGDSANWRDELYYSGDYEKPFELASTFLVATQKLGKNLNFTIGLGRGKFVGYGPRSRYFNSNFYHHKGGDWAIGCFLGMEYRPIDPISLMWDIDARDFNLGLVVRYDFVELGFGLTKIEHFIWKDSLTPRLAGSISYLRVKKKPRLGTIAGTVVDVADGSPLAAEVGILHSQIPKVLTKPELGTFRFASLRPGFYEVYVRARDYVGDKKKVRVLPGKTVYLDFELKKKQPRTGDIIGKVVDLEAGSPLIATLTLIEINRTTRSDKSGNFQFLKLRPAVYSIRAEAEGYEPGVFPAVVNAGEKTEVEIGMVKRGMVIHLRGIKFDFNKATIKPESYPILDEAAAILTSHPEIRVEIQGHTDSIGSDAYNLKLSNLRANAVRTYLIERHGIDPSRLVAKGYGESQPIADNRTREGRAKNRRVDFLILK